MMNLISILSGSDLIGFDNFTMNNFEIELKTINLFYVFYIVKKFKKVIMFYSK